MSPLVPASSSLPGPRESEADTAVGWWSSSGRTRATPGERAIFSAPRRSVRTAKPFTAVLKSVVFRVVETPACLSAASCEARMAALRWRAVVVPRSLTSMDRTRGRPSS